MVYTIIGLGNPGEEYLGTRHNVGRESVKSIKSLELIESAFFMNESGKAVKPFIKSKKEAKGLIVVHDDLDLPLGSFKISFGRGAGGHKGVESIIKMLKTQDFIRVRIGICPTTPSGKLKKPKGEEAVVKFILGKFKPAELVILKKVSKRVLEAIEIILSHGLPKAMNSFNTG